MRSDPRTRAYVARRTAEGLSTKEIQRCLKRYIVRELYPLILADLADATCQTCHRSVNAAMESFSQAHALTALSLMRICGGCCSITESENRRGLRRAAALQCYSGRAFAMSGAPRRKPRRSFVRILIANYIPLHMKSNPGESRAALKAALQESLEADKYGECCNCGNRSGSWALPSQAEDESHASLAKALPPTTTKSPAKEALHRQPHRDLNV
jgi:hypothetical protein